MEKWEKNAFYLPFLSHKQGPANFSEQESDTLQTFPGIYPVGWEGMGNRKTEKKVLEWWESPVLLIPFFLLRVRTIKYDVRTRVGSNIFRITNQMMLGSFHFKPRRGLEISSPTITLSIHKGRTVVHRLNEFPRSYCHWVAIFPLRLVIWVP